jgi:hypothetical protein
MRRHFQQKYHRQSNADRTIAILPRLSDVRGQRDNVLMSKRDDLTVVYAGGIQAWQNVPMMLDAAAALPKMRYIFLTGERWAMEQQAKSAHVINYTCNSVPPNQVPDHYLTSTYGFILRESILLNQVACPTKLVEYLYWGVIPIVLTPNIGDFSELGFMFVSLEDFCSGRLPDEDEAVQIRVTNRQVVESLFKACENELSTLRDTLRRS